MEIACDQHLPSAKDEILQYNISNLFIIHATKQCLPLVILAVTQCGTGVYQIWGQKAKTM